MARGRIVRLERIEFGVIVGAAVLPSRRLQPNHRPAVLARAGGTTLPGWIGFGERGRQVAGLCPVGLPREGRQASSRDVGTMVGSTLDRSS